MPAETRGPARCRLMLSAGVTVGLFSPSTQACRDDEGVSLVEHVTVSCSSFLQETGSFIARTHKSHRFFSKIFNGEVIILEGWHENSYIRVHKLSG